MLITLWEKLIKTKDLRLFGDNKFKFIIYWISCFELLLHPWRTRQWQQKRQKDTQLFDTVKQLESQDVSENLYHVMSQEAANSNPLWINHKLEVLIFFILIIYFFNTWISSYQFVY